MILTTANIILFLVYILGVYFIIFWLLTLIDREKVLKKNILKELPLVSVVIPAYNEEKTIAGTLNSIINLDYPRDKLEIFVVNDGSKDNTQKIVEGLIKENKNTNIILINKENGGKATALNIVLERAKGQYFVTMDADSFIKEDGLKKLLPYFADKEVGVVLPIMKIYSPKTILEKLQHYEYVIGFFYKKLMSKLNCIHVAPGPFSVYRKDIIKKLGGYKVGNLTEDQELTFNIQKHNYKIIQTSDTVVHTKAPMTLRTLYQQRNRWYKGAMYNLWDYKKLLFNKKYGDFGMIQLPSVLLSGVLALFALALVFYSVIIPAIEWTAKLRLINFDIMPFITNPAFNIHLLDINYTQVILMGFTLFLSFLALVIGHRMLQEKIIQKKTNIVSVSLFVFVYFFIIAFMWVGITFDIITGRKQRW